MGEFKNGLKHGQGTETFPGEQKYIGEYKNGLIDGKGKYSFPNGEQYQGDYKTGQKHGQGVYTFISGAKSFSKTSIKFACFISFRYSLEFILFLR